jgi:hypothetical protein
LGTGIDEGGIVIGSLAREDIPIIESGRIGSQVPLPDHGRLISCFLLDFRKCQLSPVEMIVGIIPETIHMAVLSGKYSGPAGAAYGIGDHAAVEPHPLPGCAVYIRSGSQFCQAAAISTDGLVGMVITHDENDIGGLAFPVVQFPGGAG